MKKILAGLIIVSALVFMALPAIAQNETPLKEKSKKSKEPIEITSDRMRSEDGGVKTVFSGNVITRKGDLKITSDIMEIRNTEDKKKTDEIVAIGNVVITRCSKKATGDRAIYLDKSQKIILTGSPRATAWEEDDMIEGRELIYLLEEDRFIANEKVRMKLYSKEKSQPIDQDQPCSSK